VPVATGVKGRLALAGFAQLSAATRAAVGCKTGTRAITAVADVYRPNDAPTNPESRCGR
jgi:hypothetical protein